MPYLLLILTTLFWSGNFVISRGMHADIPPLTLSFWRWCVALAILMLFGFRHFWQQRQLVKKHHRFILIQGVLGVAGFNSLIYLAVQSTTAINAVLVNSCIPVIIAVCTWIIYRELMTLRQCFGVLISLCGVSFIILRGDVSTLLNLEFNHGDLLVLAAAVIWALYSVNLKRFPEGLHPFAYLTGIVITGVICIFPLYCAELLAGAQMKVTSESILTILYVAVFASVLAFIFWNRAVRDIGANKAGPFIHLMPVFSTLLAVFFLDEKIHSFHLAGITFIFAGIAMTTLQQSTMQKSEN